MTTREVRLFIYQQLSLLGTAPDISQISKHFNLTNEETIVIMQALAQSRHIVINEKFEIVMAHPFSTVPLGFSVMGKETLWWGGCSWDSFALPNLLSQEVLVATTCPNCSAAHAWRVSPNLPPEGDQVAHFLVPTQEMWIDVVHSCANQRIFCNEICLNSWLEETNNAKGYVMNLSTLWALASNWYDGRLNLNYERREPATAAKYFREAGLSGSFWGLS